MATISNTVQGLNETVGLLKQILKAVSGDGKKGADAKDVATTSNVLNGLDESGAKTMGVVVSSLEPLDKMKEGTGEKAKSLAEAIKILSSKEVIDGLKQYNGISGKLGANIAQIFISLGEAFDKIDGGINLGRIKRFAMVLNSLTRALNRGVKVMYKIAFFVLVCVAVGYVATIAWKQILIGFVTIAAIALGIVGISYILSLISKKSPEIYKSVSEVVMSVMAFALVVAVCAVVGFIAQLAWKQILIGFVTIVAIALGIVALSYIISWTATLEQPTRTSVIFVIMTAFALALMVAVCALVGLLAVNAWQYILWGFGTIVAIAVALVAVVMVIGMMVKVLKMGSFKEALGTFVGAERIMPESVKDILLVALAVTLVPLACVAIGWVALNNQEFIWNGFAILTGVVLGLVGLLKFMGNAAKQSMRVQVSVKSLIITIGAVVAVVYSIIKLAQMLKEESIPIPQVLLVTGMMGLMMLGFNMLLKTIGKMKVNPKGIITVLAVVAVVLVMVYMLSTIADVVKKVQEIGGWGQIFLAIASMAGVIVAMMAFAAVIGALVSITIFGVPIVAMLLGVGLATITAVAVATMAVGVAVKTIANAVKECNDTGISLDDLPTIGTKMGNGLSSFAFNLIEKLSELDLWAVIKVGIMMRPISKMVNVCSQFLKMISSFSTEDCTSEELRPVFYNEEKGTFDVAPKINVPNIGTAIGTGFANFAYAIVTKLEDLGLWATYKVGIMMNPIKKMVNTCSEFLKMISSFTTEGNDSNSDPSRLIITPVIYKEDTGEFITGRPIDVVAIGETVGNAFGLFVKTVMEKIEGVDMSKYDFSGLPSMVSACTEFVSMIADITSSSDGNSINMLMRDAEGNYIKRYGKYLAKSINVKSSAQTIARAFIMFIDTLDMETRMGTGIYSKFKYWESNGVGTVIDMVQKYLGMMSDMYVTANGFVAVYMKDSEGNYIKKNGKFLVKLLNTSLTAQKIGRAFIMFIDTLDMETRNGKDIYSKFKYWENNGVGAVIDIVQKYLTLMSAFEDGANGTINVLLRGADGNYLFDGRGNIRKRNLNYNTAAFNITNAFSTFINKISEGITTADGTTIKEFANSFEQITNSFESITRVISDVSDSTAERIKRNTEAINNFADAVGRLTEELLELKGVGEVKVGVDTTVNGKSDANGKGIDGIMDNAKKSNTGGSTSADTIKEGIIKAFKEMHFEIDLGTQTGEILPVKRGSKKYGSKEFGSYAWN